MAGECQPGLEQFAQHIRGILGEDMEALAERLDIRCIVLLAHGIRNSIRREVLQQDRLAIWVTPGAGALRLQRILHAVQRPRDVLQLILGLVAKHAAISLHGH